MKRRTADRALRPRITGAGLAACFLFVCLCSPALSGEAAAPAKTETKKKSQTGGPGMNNQGPILITSDRMEVDRQKNILMYQGQVVATQGDMTMRSDKLTTYFDPDLQQIKQAIAEGKLVQVTQGDRVATGTKAVFDGVSQTMTMTGNPMMRQGNSQISGEKIIYYMVEDRMIVESGKNRRVEGTIFPEELQQKKTDPEPKKEK
jgi:lipopolysaccharide export system protein LptA